MFNMNNGTKKSSDHQLPHKPLQIQHDDKFFSRLLSKENSMAYPSSRVLYYGGRPGSVPFLWESEPGTPKSKSRDDESLALRPPLTPPPSYYFNSGHKKAIINKRSRTSNLINNIFPKKTNNLSLKKAPNYFNTSSYTSPNPFWSSSVNSSILVSLDGSNSKATEAAAGFRGRSASRISSSSSSTSFEWRGGHEEDQEVGSPSSTLCFGCYRF